MSGLLSGCDAPLEVREGGVCDRGVFATSTISKGNWLCEYKAGAVFGISEKAAIEAEYEQNGEGSYIIESTFSIASEGRICFDATRKFTQIGRYINHAQRPNAKLTRPFKIRGKWRIGFLAIRDIGVGEEVVWDYGVRGEDWSGCRLVGGVVRNPPTQQVGGEVKEGDAGEVPEMVTEPASPVLPEGVAGPSHPAKPAPKGDDQKKGKQKRNQKDEKRTYCMCPLCGTGPHAKISNHLATQHHLTPKARARYLFGNRIIATPQQMMSKVKKPQEPVRKSQRTIIGAFKKVEERSGGEMEVVEVEERSGGEEVEVVDNSDDSPTPSAGGSGAEESDSAPPSPSYSRSLCPEPPTSTTVITEETDLPGPSSASLTEKSTRNAPRFDLTDPFLTVFSEHLASRLGGKKDPVQCKETCIDVSKYLYYSDPKECNPDHLVSRASIRKYVAWLEAGGIGASGVCTKLRRLQMAIKCLGLQHEDLETETTFREMKDRVWELLTSFITSLSRQKRKTQRAKLDHFAHHIPDLSQISDFITSRRVKNFIDATVATAKAGGEVEDDTLEQCMYLIAGRLMLR